MSFPFEDSAGAEPGSGGTVTSVAGGVGLTGTPDPIVGAGTLDLDIDSLTLESSLASGDLFPFVDVSAVGTPIAQQRKTTLGDIQTFVGAASQPLDADLTVIAALVGTGILSRTAADTWVLTPGTAGRALFWSTSGLVPDDDNGFFWNDTDKRLIVGSTVSPPTSAFVVGGVSVPSSLTAHTTGTSTLGLAVYAATAPFSARATFARARGTEALPTVVSDGDSVGSLLFVAHDGTDYGIVGQVIAEVDEASPGAGAMGGALVFYTTTAGTTTIGERLRLAADGDATFSGSVDIRNVAYTWPAANAAGYLRNNGSGTLSWDATGAGIDHGGLGGLGDDDHSIYLLLAGRTGSTNDPVLSTSTGGLISGSSASGAAIDVQSTTHATKGLINLRDEARLRTALTSVTGVTTDTFLARGVLSSVTVDGGLSNFLAVGVTGTLIQNTAPVLSIHALFSVGTPFNAFTYQNASGVSTFATLAALANYTTFKAITTNVTAGHIIAGLQLNDSYARDASITMTGVDRTGVHDNPSIGTGCTLDERRTVWVRNKGGSGSQNTAVGLEMDDQTVNTLGATVRSAMASGTGKWFLLGTGTAVSAILGGVRFGSGSAVPDGSSVVHIDGGYTQKRTAATDADYTALLTDCIIEFPAITANRVLNLPTVASAGAGKVYYLVKTTGGFSITIDPNGAELVNGAATLAALGAAATYDTVRIYCTGAAWIASLMV